MSDRGGIVVLDFGGQYTQLIARRIREQQVFSAILPCNASVEKIKQLEPSGVVLSGGPSSVYDGDAPVCDERVLNLGIPVLGICYGLQWITYKLGGRVEPAERREYGRAELHILNGSPLFSGLPAHLRIWNSHGDNVRALPPGFRVTGETGNAVSAAEDPERRIYAVQFHPEVLHTERGTDILRNFVFGICHAKLSWSGAGFIAETVEKHPRPGGRRQSNLRPQWRRGFRRRGCARSSCDRRSPDERFRGHRPAAQERIRRDAFAPSRSPGAFRDRRGRRPSVFSPALKGVEDPETKRKIIGAEFIAIFAEHARAAGGVKFLVQGTLYPDVIESVPVRGPVFHDQVSPQRRRPASRSAVRADRAVARAYSRTRCAASAANWACRRRCSPSIHFPGPDLAVRILGEITPQRLATLRDADAIVVEEIRRAGLYEKTWQAFAVLLPVRSVGVMGDSRSYGNAVAVRVVESDDAMTADWSRLPAELLERISTRIVNEVAGVNRVVYDISSKPPSTIEWE